MSRSCCLKPCFCTPPCLAILVFLAGYVLFVLGTGAGNLSDPSLDIAHVDESHPDHPEIRERFVWMASLLLFTVTATFTGSVGWSYLCQGFEMGREKSSDGGQVPWGCCAVLCFLVFVSILLADFCCVRAVSDHIYGFTMYRIENSPIYSDCFACIVKTIMFFVNFIFTLVPTSCLLVLAGKSVNPSRFDRGNESITNRGPFCAAYAHYRCQARTLNVFLDLASLLMIAGVIHQMAWLHWATALVDKRSADIVAAEAQGIATFWAAVYSLMIGVTFGVATLTLRRRVQRYLDCDPLIAKPQDWLSQNGFAASPTQHIHSIGLSMAPLLAIPVAALIRHIAEMS